MSNCKKVVAPEAIHPALWRASQVLKPKLAGLDTGFAQLSQQLPGQGWPLGTLIDFALQQSGIGELQLLKHALLHKQKHPIALISPPLIPNIMTWQQWGGKTAQLYTINTSNMADALWSCEKMLKQGCFGAVVLWQEHIHIRSLRRLHIAAKHHDTLFIVMRSLLSLKQHSPASLRLQLTPKPKGLDIHIIKRLGTPLDTPIFIPLYPSTRQHHALLDQHPISTPAARHPLSELARPTHSHH